MSKVAEFLGNLVGMPNQPTPKAMKSSDARKKEHAELWAKDTKARKPREQQWQLNMSMTMGNQWVGWNGTAVQTLPAPTWRVQSVDNKIFVRVRGKQTRLLQDMTVVVLPETSEQTDVRRAEYKERLAHHISRTLELDLLKFQASQWVVVCGEVYTEAFWNESAGDTYADESGAFSEGDVGLKIHDPFAVWPGSGCSSRGNGGRLWTAELVPVDLARMKYGDIEIAPDATEGSDIKLRASMESFFSGGTRNTIYPSSNTGLEDCVLIKTLREYRTKENPQGRISTIINGKVYGEPQPLLWDGITHIINYPSFNSYYGDAVEVRNAIQPQKSINRIQSSWEEYVKTMAKGRILCHKGANIKSSAFDSEHFEKVLWEGQTPPDVMAMPPMPSDIGNLIALKTSVIDDYFAEHMASQGKSPASASGSAINYLQEQDQLQHLPSKNLWLRGWERTMEKMLDVVCGQSGSGGYDAERNITILGEDRRADVQRVDVDMLQGKNRVHIICGGALPENKTLRTELVRRMFADGMLGSVMDPDTARRARKMIDAGMARDVDNDEFLDEIRAEKENKALSEPGGEMIAPRPEDNHRIHIYTHKHYQKGDEFLTLLPEQQDIHYAHTAIHEQALMPPMLPGLPGMPNDVQPVPPGNNPNPGSPDTSAAAQNPVDMLKSVQQEAEPPSGLG